MSLSNLEVFSGFAYTTMTEMLAQNVNAFNAASRGGVTLRTAANVGDYSDIALWAKVANLVRRRDAYGSGAAPTANLAHLLKTTVKVASGTPEVELDPGAMEWIQRNPEEYGTVLGEQLAKDTLADMLNTGIMAYVAAIGGVAAVVHDGTAGTANLSALNSGASKFGDASGEIGVWIAHSKPVFDIYGSAITNTERLFQYGNVQVVQDGFGRPIIMSDSASLITTGTPDTYHTLGLTTGGILIEQNGDFTSATPVATGSENIKRTYQAEWSYNLGIKGFSWDKTNGGHSPNDAALGTGTNWDQFATSNKDLAGVMVNTQ